MPRGQSSAAECSGGYYSCRRKREILVRVPFTSGCNSKKAPAVTGAEAFMGATPRGRRGFILAEVRWPWQHDRVTH